MLEQFERSEENQVSVRLRAFRGARTPKLQLYSRGTTDHPCIHTSAAEVRDRSRLAGGPHGRDVLFNDNRSDIAPPARRRPLLSLGNPGGEAEGVNNAFWAYINAQRYELAGPGGERDQTFRVSGRGLFQRFPIDHSFDSSHRHNHIRRAPAQHLKFELRPEY